MPDIKNFYKLLIINTNSKKRKMKSLNPLNLLKLGNHPAIAQKRTFSQKAADKLTSWLGSWTFILFFAIILAAWISVNGYFFLMYELGKPWDPFPFILLNLILSCLAALQAPIILMSQNRQAQKDRIHAEYDYQVNRKAEREIEEIQKQLKKIENKFSKK